MYGLISFLIQALRVAIIIPLGVFIYSEGKLLRMGGSLVNRVRIGSLAFTSSLAIVITTLFFQRMFRDNVFDTGSSIVTLVGNFYMAIVVWYGVGLVKKINSRRS
jgi:hypothetical protein